MAFQKLKFDDLTTCSLLWCGGVEAAIAIGQTLMSYPSDHLRRNSRLSLNKPPIQETIATYQTWLEQSRPYIRKNSGTVNTTDLIVRVVQM